MSEETRIRGVVVEPDSPVLFFAAGQLTEFWNRSCGTHLVVKEDRNEGLKRGWCFVGTSDVDSKRTPKVRDGFSVRSKQMADGIAWEISGSSVLGAKQGLWQLLREAELLPGAVHLPSELSVTRSPFFRQRYFMLSTPLLWNRFLTAKESRFAYQTWPPQARRDYVSSLDMMGFNMIQVSDEVGERYAFRFQKSRRRWQHELIDILSHAGRLGLHRLLFVWAASIGLPARPGAPNAFSSRGFNPDDPDDSLMWSDHIERLANYSPYVEEILTHWGDPGGFEGATIEDAQRIHMRIWKRFQRENGAIGSIFSLWMLHHRSYGKWSGYEGPRTIIDGGILPPEVSLAMHARVNVEEARLISSSGRRCGPWVWYLADNEINPGLHVHVDWFDEYFGSLASDVADIVDFHGVELNCHQLNHASVYVAARKLWDPHDPADRILAEYCELVFGPNAGQAMLRGYRAVAHTRCISDYGHRDIILGFQSESGAQYVGEDPSAEVVELDEAVEMLKAVEIDSDWIPRIPLPTTPAQMREDLMVHLEEIRKYAQFRKERATAGNDPDALLGAADWKRPDGYLLHPERQEIERYIRDNTIGE